MKENQHTEGDLPLWFCIIMVVALSGMIFWLIAHEANKQRHDRNEYLRENFSRMSTDPEVQEAYEEYDREHPLGNAAYDTLAFECP